jgi:CRP-like cAMP-binding protein
MTGLEAYALLLDHSSAGFDDHPSAGEWADVLSTFPLFSKVGKRRLRSLARNATVSEFAPGDIVLAPGDNADSLYLILGGEARVLGAPTRRALGSGDFFGGVAVVDGTARSATVVATRGLHVMRLPWRALLRLARRHPAIPLTVLENLGS